MATLKSRNYCCRRPHCSNPPPHHSPQPSGIHPPSPADAVQAQHLYLVSALPSTNHLVPTMAFSASSSPLYLWQSPSLPPTPPIQLYVQHGAVQSTSFVQSLPPATSP